MGNKERVSIAFMKDMADDLARKKVCILEL